jgi:hypothetical protein
MAQHPDLESARRKLDRANEHVVEIQREITRWGKLQANGLPFRQTTEYDAQLTGLWIKVESIADPPPILSLILGDALSNARSSLDHAAWQMVQHGTSTNLKPGDEHKVYFPIFDTLDEFNRILPERLPGLRPAEEAIVRRYQPYTRGNPLEHPLAVLREFSNSDKHRNIHLVVWMPSDLSIEIDDWEEGCEPLSIVQGPDLGKALSVDAKLAFVTLRDPVRCGQTKGRVHVKSYSVLAITFENGWRVDAVMGYAVLTIREILSEIDRVL